MKLINVALLTVLSLSAFKFAAAEEVDAEVIIDDDGEADIDDDVASAEADEAEAEPVDETPQLQQTPLAGVRSFAFFPDGPASITGGKVAEMVVGVQNNGDTDIQMVSIMGRMMMPEDMSQVVQNFTNVGYDKQDIPAKGEASFSYAFLPHLQTGGRDFHVVIEAYYKEKDNNKWYRAAPFEDTISILETQEGVLAEIVQLWMTLIALFCGGGYYVWTKMQNKKIIQAAVAAEEKKKQERGTVGDEVDMAWIPKAMKSKKKAH